MAASAEHKKRVKDAVETLFEYNLDPFVRGFVRSQPQAQIQAILNKDNLQREITAALLGKQRRGDGIDLDVLLEYLDGLQLSGRQHIFLLTLPEEYRGELEALRDAEQVKQRLAVKGFAAAYNVNHVIYETANAPELAEVRHEPPQRLVVKWVETRTWWEHQGWKHLPAAGVQTARRKQRAERSVNYFHLDLASGDAEIRIQMLRTDAQKTRTEAFEEYRSLAAELIGCDHLVQLVLAPAIRRALAGANVDWTQVTVELPGGGPWSGRKGDVFPVEPEKVRATVYLEYDWRDAHGHPVRVGLDGRIDEVQISKPCSPEDLRTILESVRGWYREAVSESPSLDLAVLEYLASHPESKVTKDLPAAGNPAGDPDRSEEARHGQFSNYIKTVADSKHDLYVEEVRQLQHDHQQASKLYRAAITGAILLVVIGGICIIMGWPNRLTAATLTAVTGLLTGGVSRLLHHHSDRLEKRRASAEKRLDKILEVLRDIQAAREVAERAARSAALKRVYNRARDLARQTIPHGVGTPPRPRAPS